MSTWVYALLTTNRDRAAPGTSVTTAPPGVKTYVDALAALVPAEVLTLHALMLSATTQIRDNATTITEPHTLAWAFAGLVAVSVLLYALPRLRSGQWDNLDWARITLPPLAFLAWTMLQRSTAFDAIIQITKWPVTEGARTVIALFAAVMVGYVATSLAYRADLKDPAR